MSQFWRQVGMNYVQYSRICATVVRQCIKGDKVEIAKRGECLIKPTLWKDGKAIKNES